MHAASVLFFGRSNCDGTKKALTFLKACDFDVYFIESNGMGEPLPQGAKEWHGEYILCFRSLFILPKELIERASIAAINFHPASVEYPGSACLNFALYDQVEEYGVTAHLMNEKVDSGAIIECRRFPVFPNDVADSLLQRTHAKLLDLFFDIVANLVRSGPNFLTEKISRSSSEKWRGEARRMKDYEKLKRIPLDIGDKELDRIIRATYMEKWPPSIVLHGYEFFLKNPIKRFSSQ